MPDCGTYAGYQAHGRRKEQSCAVCQAAAAEYMREYRATKPDAYKRERFRAAARERALWKLAKLHPVQFRQLYIAEMANARRAADDA